MNRRVLIILPILVLLAMPALAAEARPIGYVDMQLVLDKSKMGQQAQQALKEKFAGRQKELAEEEQSIRQLQQTLARDKALMSKAELEKKTAEITSRIQGFQQKATQAQQDLTQEQNKLGNRIVEPAQAIIEALAKDKQVSAIFDRRQSGLLYIDDGLDLTPEVIKRLDSREKKK